jgi:hypothetical protein
VPVCFDPVFEIPACEMSEVEIRSVLPTGL